MDTLTLLSTHWSTVAGALSLLGALTVLVLATKFPRRKEVEDTVKRLHERMDAIELRMEKTDLLLKEIGERLKSVDEKVGWRFCALENQVTILMRGHLEWGNHE